MVLAHEGQHAMEDLDSLLGPGQACYDAEVDAFTVQVLLSGMTSPRSPLW
jgi:hypothetical protein